MCTRAHQTVPEQAFRGVVASIFWRLRNGNFHYFPYMGANGAESVLTISSVAIGLKNTSTIGRAIEKQGMTLGTKQFFLCFLLFGYYHCSRWQRRTLSDSNKELNGALDLGRLSCQSLIGELCRIGAHIRKISGFVHCTLHVQD